MCRVAAAATAVFEGRHACPGRSTTRCYSLLLRAVQLRKDTRAELPLWLAKSLTERGITRMDAPAAYGEW